MSLGSQKLLQSLRVAVVGWGTAGQAAALALQRVGVQRLHIFDKLFKATTVGAGMLLQPSGQMMLEHLGLLPEVRRYGARIDRLWGTAPYDTCKPTGKRLPGKTVLDLRYGDHVDWSNNVSYGIGIHRATLFNLLDHAFLDQAGKRGNTEFTRTLSTEISDVKQQGDGTSVLIDSNNDQHGPFDAVIIANGSASQLRDRLCASAPPLSSPLLSSIFPSALSSPLLSSPLLASPLLSSPLYPWGALWAVMEERDWPHTSQLMQVYDGCSVMIGVLPIGRCTDFKGTLDSTSQKRYISFFWSVACSDMPKWQAKPLDEWKAHVLERWPQAEVFLSQITDMSQLIPARYRDVIMRRWHQHNTVFIGDAAHGTSPQLGQGANMALVDGVTLAHCLQDASEETSTAQQCIASAYKRYQDTRRSHLWYFQTASRLLTPIFQSDSKAIGTLRDFFMGPMCKMPVARDQMIRTLVGMRAGLFGEWTPPPPLPPL